MALVKCPECGGQISTMAKQCIHCGCEIKVCPECNGVYIAGVENCKGCGYIFAKETIKEENSAKTQALDMDGIVGQGIKNLKSMSPLSVFLLITYLIFQMVGIIVLFIPFVKVITFDVLKGNYLKFLTTYAKLNSFIVAGAVLVSLGTIFSKICKLLSERK